MKKFIKKALTFSLMLIGSTAIHPASDRTPPPAPTESEGAKFQSLINKMMDSIQKTGWRTPSGSVTAPCAHRRGIMFTVGNPEVTSKFGTPGYEYNEADCLKVINTPHDDVFAHSSSVHLTSNQDFIDFIKKTYKESPLSGQILAVRYFFRTALGGITVMNYTFPRDKMSESLSLIGACFCLADYNPNIRSAAIAICDNSVRKHTDLCSVKAVLAVRSSGSESSSTAPLADYAQRKCGSCSKTAEETTLLSCAKCHITRYCSKECQRADWPAHKNICKTCPKISP